MRVFLILELLLLKLMHSGRVGLSFRLLMSLAMLKSMKLLLSDGQGAPLNPRTNPHGNGRLLHLYQLLLLSPLQVLTMFTAVTIVNLETMLIDVFSPVPGLKTTSPAFTLPASSPGSNLIFLQVTGSSLWILVPQFLFFLTTAPSHSLALFSPLILLFLQFLQPMVDFVIILLLGL